MKRNENQKQRAMDESTPAGELRSLAAESVALARLVAKNPAAPAGLLEKLTKHKDVTVRQNVAMHPGTPVDALLTLAEKCTASFLKNPLLDLLFLENPSLLETFSPELNKKVAENRNTPASTLEQLAGDKDEWVRRGVARNPNAPRSHA